MILHGIEYQRPTSLNMADHVTYSFLAFMKSIFHFCLGCYCGGYSQNGRSNLSSFDLLKVAYDIMLLGPGTKFSMQTSIHLKTFKDTLAPYCNKWDLNVSDKEPINPTGFSAPFAPTTWASRWIVWVYRKVSNIRRTKSQNLSVSHLGLQLFLSNRLKPSVQWRMKM